MFFKSLFFVLLATCFALAGDTEFKTNENGLDKRNFDTNVDPCDDFYLYANGQWLKNNPVPDEYTRWGAMNELSERNQALLKRILEDAAQGNPAKGSIEQMIGDFYKVAMDVEAIEKAGFKPVKPYLEEVDALKSREDVAKYIAASHAKGISQVFSFAVYPDFQDSTRNIAFIAQGGLGLPDRDYYLREGEEADALREAYKGYIANLFKLIGDDQKDAESKANSIFEMEKAFAEASLTNVELRDPSMYYRIVTMEEADKEMSAYSWSHHFKTLGLGDLETFSFPHTKFNAQVDQMLNERSVSDWQAYFTFHLVDTAAPYLSQDFVDEHFRFNSQTLAGAKKLQERWKRVLRVVNRSMGEALGRLYVKEAFPPEAKSRALNMIDDLKGALSVRLQNLDWMSADTKKMALKKLDSFTAKIGYPDKWTDYSSLKIGKTSYFENMVAALSFNHRLQLAKVGNPVDPTEWAMPPQIVNAYYNPLNNEIVFPAGIMQPPFFDPKADDAVNYGAMGAVIGHEIMHGFDDSGSRFDADGNLKNWWTEEDLARFQERTQSLVQQFNSYEPLEGLHVNGELTLGENIGDMGGLTIAYYGLQKAVMGKEVGLIDGLTQDQRFFLSWAQAWRTNTRDEALKLQINTDPHSPAHYRGNGPLVNMPEFQEAFGCKEGDNMVAPPEKRVKIW